MTTVYLIRHGQSEGNERRVYCGWTELPLTEVGETQVRRLAETVPHPRPCHIVTSDLIRVAGTARVLSESWRLDVTVDKGFREMHFGAFHPATWEAVTDKYPALAAQWTGSGSKGARRRGIS